MVLYVKFLSRMLYIICVQSLILVIGALNVTGARGDTATAADLKSINQ
jgi:hypothetical protein